MKASDKHILRTSKLCIGYNGKGEAIPIQSELDLKLKRGELCCLIGPNGVGKSTLLKTISTQLSPLKGEIWLNGKNLSKFNNEELSQNLSLVLTESIQIPNMRVSELVAMGRFPYTNFWGRLEEQDRKIVNEALVMADINALKNRRLETLSDGEKQKVFIAKALAQDTPLMILDEPTAYLDFPSKMAILMELRKIARSKNIAIVVSTHDLELALKMADRIWLMPEKNKFKDGFPEDLVLQGAIGQAFSNNYLSFDLESAHFTYHNQGKDILFVEGNCTEIEWLRRALKRIGINPQSVKPQELHALYNSTEKIYLLKKNNTIIAQCKTIQAFIEQLKTNT